MLYLTDGYIYLIGWIIIQYNKPTGIEPHNFSLMNRQPIVQKNRLTIKSDIGGIGWQNKIRIIHAELITRCAGAAVLHKDDLARTEVAAR